MMNLGRFFGCGCSAIRARFRQSPEAIWNFISKPQAKEKITIVEIFPDRPIVAPAPFQQVEVKNEGRYRGWIESNGYCSCCSSINFIIEEKPYQRLVISSRDLDVAEDEPSITTFELESDGEGAVLTVSQGRSILKSIAKHFGEKIQIERLHKCGPA